MNCSDLISSLGFECMQLSERTMRVWSPFTYGPDGEFIGFFVEKTNAGYRVTDAAESLQHAESLGIQLSKKRLDFLRSVVGDPSLISPGGEIAASTNEAGLSETMAAVLNAAMAVSHLEFRWMPRGIEDSFTTEVGAKLDSVLPPGALKRNVVLVGASGHQIEIPFALTINEADTYVQPIASDNGRVNWTNVYRGFGKMMDLKYAGAEPTRRVVVVDDRETATDELDQSITLLTTAASVVRFGGMDTWLAGIAA